MGCVVFSEKKRIRYKIPTYNKADKINANIKSFPNNPKHIFRLKTLFKIYEEIAEIILKKQNLLLFDDFSIEKDGIRIYLNLYQKAPYEWFSFKEKRYKIFVGEHFSIVDAEIIGTESFSLGEKLKIHIALLRLLRSGFTAKKAMQKIKNKKIFLLFQ